MPRFDGTTLLRKITVKDVMRGVRYKEEEDGTPLKTPRDLFAVWGYAREVRTEDSSYKDQRTGKAQEYNRYFGDFQAKCFYDGSTFRSTQLILDNFSSDLLYETFMLTRKNDEEGDINFAFIIGVEPFRRGDENKFRHTLKPVLMGDDDLPDPLAAVTAKMLDNMPEQFKGFFAGQPALESFKKQAIEHKESKSKA